MTKIKKFIIPFLAGALTLAVIYLGYVFYSAINTVYADNARLTQVVDFLNDQIKASQPQTTAGATPTVSEGAAK